MDSSGSGLEEVTGCCEYGDVTSSPLFVQLMHTITFLAPVYMYTGTRNVILAKHRPSSLMMIYVNRNMLEQLL